MIKPLFNNVVLEIKNTEERTSSGIFINGFGNTASNITLMVESSAGNTCYLEYFILYKFYTNTI